MYATVRYPGYTVQELALGPFPIVYFLRYLSCSSFRVPLGSIFNQSGDGGTIADMYNEYMCRMIEDTFFEDDYRYI